MKKISIIFLIFFMMFAFISPVLAGTTTSSQEAVAQQGQSQGITYAPTSDVRNINFPVPTVPIYGIIPQMFANPSASNGPNFIPGAALVDFMGAVKIRSLHDEDLDMDDIKIDITETDFIATHCNDADKVENPEKACSVEVVKFAIAGTTNANEIKSTSTVVAIGIAQANDEDDINSAELYEAIALKAAELCATKVILITEGTEAQLSSWGVGIGLSYNYAKIMEGGDHPGSSVGTGGTGWSTGRAKYNKIPYMSFVILR